MASPQSLSQLVETYRFADVAALWARERMEHETIVARALARAVVCDGLLLHSIDSRRARGSAKPLELCGYPYVGYTAKNDGAVAILRITALDHLIGIVERGEEPDMGKLRDEFIHRRDFRAWLDRAGLPAPKFWYSA